MKLEKSSVAPGLADWGLGNQLKFNNSGHRDSVIDIKLSSHSQILYHSQIFKPDLDVQTNHMLEQDKLTY